MTTMPAPETPRLRIDRKALYLLVALLLLVGVTQAQNLFGYPYIQDAEGTNLSKSWALLNTGELSPYTYAYDEPPAGSVFLSLWATLTRAVSTLDLSVESGRILMLACRLVSVALIFGIARKLTGSTIAAILAALIFAFSPLLVALQRRILVDNFMLMWLLAAFYLAVGDYRRLKHYLVSAFCFGLAVLSKEGALFFLPAFLYTIRSSADSHHRRFAWTLWLTLSFMLIAFYPIYAQMKMELFPQGWLLGGDFPHVSLLEAMLDRGPTTGTFLNIGSGLSESFRAWVDVDSLTADPILIYGGAVSFFFVLIMSLDNKRLRPLLAMTLAGGLYLLLGGKMFDSSVLFVAPFLALLIAVLLNAVIRLVGNLSPQPVLKFILGSLALLALAYPFLVYYATRIEAYTLDQVSGQRQAVDWVQANVPENAVIVTDNFAFVELRQTFPDAHHYWRVDTDPEIKYLLLNDSVCNIDYVISTPQVVTDIQTFHLDLMGRALENSQLLVAYQNNGWPVEIRQVSKRGCGVVSLDS